MTPAINSTLLTAQVRQRMRKKNIKYHRHRYRHPLPGIYPTLAPTPVKIPFSASAQAVKVPTPSLSRFPILPLRFTQHLPALRVHIGPRIRCFIRLMLPRLLTHAIDSAMEMLSGGIISNVVVTFLV
jgi:hypothetical protein